MKKRIALYGTAWTVVLALFNVISFVCVGLPGQEKYTASFWIGYGFITAALVGQLVCSCVTFKVYSAGKLFYRISLLRAGYICLIVSFAAGALCMLFSSLPYWVGILVCAIVLAVDILSVVKATAAIGEAERVDVQTDAQTHFIKSLTQEAEMLTASAKSEPARKACQKVCEAVRYSDPVSSPALAETEAQITAAFAELSESVRDDDVEKAAETAEALLRVLDSRNKQCKRLK